MNQPLTFEPIDWRRLDRELDRTKSAAFLGKNAAFLGSLLCGMEFEWSKAFPTAATNGFRLWWNPDFYMGLSPRARETVLIHELWHPGRLHFIRMGNRDPLIWNYACVAQNTLIAMADGTEKPVQLIKSGDQIRNVKNGISTVAVRLNSSKKEIYNIRFENGMLLRCSGDHKVLTQHVFQTAAQLTVGTPCFVDTRYGRVSQSQLGHDAHTGHRGPVGHEIPSGRVEGLRDRAHQDGQTVSGILPDAPTVRPGMGLSSWAGGWGRDDYSGKQNGEGQAVSSTQDACLQHLPQNAGLVDGAGVSLSATGEQQGVLVLYPTHSSNSFEGCVGEVAPLAGHQAALSNARAAMDRAEDSTSIQVHLDARDALHSRSNPFLEYSRISEIWKSSPEETFDLVTSGHHFIADGVVVHNCDIRINNDLKEEGYSFEGLEGCWMDPRYGPDVAEEDIYDDLVKNNIQPPSMQPFPGMGLPGAGDPTNPAGGDMVPMDPMDKNAQARAINNVVRAVQQANLGAGSVPGGIETILNRFLKPVIPWEQVLRRFMSDLFEESYSWKRPNRRYSDMYLPSRFMDEGRLEHLMYYEDVSGSITDEDVVRFNSEVKHVWEYFNPGRMSLVQFDTRITQEVEFHEGDRFERIKVVGRGGTSLVPVREHIIKHRPTAAIIFSDLVCDPMEPLPFDIPVIWVAIRNHKATVPFGQLVHIR
jgi:predicted metal-dependent peptidase